MRQIREKDPVALVWFMTAFEVYRSEFEKMFPDTDVSVFLRKPISLNELTAKIESGLDSKAKHLLV